MKRAVRVGFGYAGVVVLAMVPFGECGAQGLGNFYLGTWGGEAGLRYTSNRVQTSSASAPTSSLQNQSYEERLTVRNQGFYYLDPRLVSGSLSLTFGLRQDYSQGGGASKTSRGRLDGYAFSSTILGSKPYNATLYADRNRNYAWRQLGGRTESSLQSEGVTLQLRDDSVLRDWGLPYFSTSLGVYSQHLTETTTGADLQKVFRRDERLNGIRLNSHKGFETADLDFNYESIDHEFPDSRQTPYRTTSAAIRHSVDFGANLNRRLDSRIRYSDRGQQAPLKLVNVDEHLRIDHYKNLSTDYRYQLTRTETAVGVSESQGGYFGLQHKLYRNLTTSASLSAARQDLPAGTQSSEGANLNLAYQHGLPQRGRLFASAGGGYRLNDNRLTASRIDVVDASYTAPSMLGAGAGFLLEHGFIDASTIVVVDTRGGARLSTTLGVDYDLAPEGNLIKVVPLPTSLVIQPGDPLAVSYTYVVDPSIGYATISRKLGGGVDLRWITVSARHAQTDQVLRSGEPRNFLQNSRDDEADLALRGGWKTSRAEAGANYKRYTATFLAYSRRRLRQIISYRRRRTLLVAFNAEQTNTDYTLPARWSKTRSVQLNVTWLAPGAWWTTALFARRTDDESASPAETINEAKLTARKTYGQTQIGATLAYNDRQRDNSRGEFWHFDLNLTRRF